MDYRPFAAARRETYDAFEEGLAKLQRARHSVTREELEGLAFQYRQLLQDHALVRSRFPGTSLARRVERLVMAGTHALQRDRGDHLPGLFYFMSRAFPMAMRRVLPFIGVAAGLFALAGLFGFTLTVVEPGLGSAFLSPDAVENLARGELWTDSIFAVTPSPVASAKIATNNLSVMLTAWGGGMLAGLGALWVVLLNGLMLGSVIAVVARYSMADPLLEFIAAHGPLEISLILVAAAAGARVGMAWVWAGEVPRADALRSSGRDALTVLLGCLPWIVILGFVEGFISPNPELPVHVKTAIGLMLEGIFVLIAWNPILSLDSDSLDSDSLGSESLDRAAEGERA